MGGLKFPWQNCG